MTAQNGHVTRYNYNDADPNRWGLLESITDATRTPVPEMLGLSFFRNRFYDQETGRWTQEDPIGVAGGHNLYQYAGNNPVSYSDPFGLCPPKDDKPCNLNTGDPYLDQVTIRQNLEDAYESAPESKQFRGLRQEVGGRCSQTECSRYSDGIYSAEIGRPTATTILNYHTHPNSGKANPSERGNVFLDGPSRPDITNAADASRYGLPSYILTPNSIYRLTPTAAGVTSACFQRWTNSSKGCR